MQALVWQHDKRAENQMNVVDPDIALLSMPPPPPKLKEHVIRSDVAALAIDPPHSPVASDAFRMQQLDELDSAVLSSRSCELPLADVGLTESASALTSNVVTPKELLPSLSSAVDSPPPAPSISAPMTRIVSASDAAVVVVAAASAVPKTTTTRPTALGEAAKSKTSAFTLFARSMRPTVIDSFAGACLLLFEG